MLVSGLNICCWSFLLKIIDDNLYGQVDLHVPLIQALLRIMFVYCASFQGCAFHLRNGTLHEGLRIINRGPRSKVPCLGKLLSPIKETILSFKFLVHKSSYGSPWLCILFAFRGHVCSYGWRFDKYWGCGNRHFVSGYFPSSLYWFFCGHQQSHLLS